MKKLSGNSICLPLDILASRMTLIVHIAIAILMNLSKIFEYNE